MFRRIGFLGACLLGVAPAVCCAADSLIMSDNLTVEGQVIRDTPGDPLIVINTGGKLLCLNRSEIGAVQLDDEGRAEYRRRIVSVKEKDAAGHFELYKWAKAERFYDYADQELAATLKADPNHAEARKIAYAPAKVSKPTEIAPGTKAELVEVPFIGLRPMSPAQRVSSEYEERVISYCKALMPTFTADDGARKAALDALTKDKTKASEVVLSYLDASKGGAEDARLAALAGIEALKPVSPEASNRLALTAMNDPSPAVRKQTAAVIKSRNDEYAMSQMVKTYISQFDEESGYVRDPVMKVAAAEALRALADPRVFGTMLYYATMETRATNTELAGFVTRQIDTFTVNSGAMTNVLVLLSFPIQFPELKITKVNTTVKAPCAALSDFTGQNFGNDVEKWAKWARMNKQ